MGRGGQRRKGGDTWQSATTQKRQRQHKQRGGEGVTREVCGGPAPNPASAPGFRNRGVKAAKTHSLPACRLNEPASVFGGEARSPPHLQSRAHTHTAKRPGSHLMPSLRIPLHDYLNIITHCWPMNCCRIASVIKEALDALKSLQPNQVQRCSKDSEGGGCFCGRRSFI